jgi:peptidoglycan/LPS O-acetylase OafA/YrhL
MQESSSLRAIHITYMVTLLVPALFQLMQKVLSSTGGFASRYGPLLVMLILVIGYLGQFRRIAILRRWVWQFCFLLIVLLTSCALFFVAYSMISGVGAMGPILMMLAVIILTLPAQVTLYHYIKNDNIWG